MESTFPGPACGTQNLERNITETVLDTRNSPGHRYNEKPRRRNTDPQESKSKVRPELSIYSKEFQQCAGGRRGTVHLPVSVAKVCKDTYQKWPQQFTEEMVIEFNLYKTATASSASMGQLYNQSVASYGGLQKLTVTQHMEMLGLCRGTMDEHLTRVQPSPMVLEYHWASFLRETFNEKYPYAYDTYEAKMRHEKVAWDLRKCQQRNAEYHAEKIHAHWERIGLSSQVLLRH